MIYRTLDTGFREHWINDIEDTGYRIQDTG